MSKNNDWKERLNIVYSTNPDFSYETEEEPQPATLPAEKQALRIELDKRHRNGKTATLITGLERAGQAPENQMRRRRFGP